MEGIKDAGPRQMCTHINATGFRSSCRIKSGVGGAMEPRNAMGAATCDVTQRVTDVTHGFDDT